jgi:hypothetical protein
VRRCVEIFEGRPSIAGRVALRVEFHLVIGAKVGVDVGVEVRRAAVEVILVSVKLVHFKSFHLGF